MKKIISVFLCLLMLVPMLTFGVGAADEGTNTDPLTNVAKSGSTYASGTWNYWSHHKYLIDGTLNSTYMFWRPAKPGETGYSDDSYFGIKFKQYYELHSITMYAEINSSNVKYTVMALVNGEWQEVKVFTRDNYISGSEYKVTGLGDSAKYVVNFDEPVLTKNIRIKCEGYSGWFPPIVHELEVYGKLGATPEYDLRDGAILSVNACLGAMMEASSGTSGRAAAYAADTDTDAKDGVASTRSLKTWKSQSKNDGENITAVFEKAFEINKVSLNFGRVPEREAGYEYVIDIDLLVDGTWKTVQSGVHVTTSASETPSLVYDLDDSVIASAMKVTFVSMNGNQAVLNEMGAAICDGKRTEFLFDYLTNDRQLSLAAGNLAPYGKAYASSTFDFSSISDVNYLNDGVVSDGNGIFSWFAATTEVGTYCGVTLMDKHKVDNVVLYFNDPVTDDGIGEHVMSYDIMAKVGDEFVKVGEGTSFDGTKYQVSIKLENPVETDDIRVVFKSCGQTYPYMKELEVYETGYKYPSYAHAATMHKALAVTKEFAEISYAKRSSYLDTISPIQTLSALVESASMQRYI